MSGSKLSTPPQLDILDSAAELSETADIVSLAQELLVDADLPTAGSVFLRLAQIILSKASTLDSPQNDGSGTVFDDIEFTDFNDFGLAVVGHVEINLDDLLLPIEHHYPPDRLPPSSSNTSLSSEQMQEEGLNLAHCEDIPGWSKRIYAVLSQGDSAASLPELQASTGLSLVEIWLGLLLGGLEVSITQQSNDFYSLDGIEVCWLHSVR